jgi:hypothetical protein
VVPVVRGAPAGAPHVPDRTQPPWCSAPAPPCPLCPLHPQTGSKPGNRARTREKLLLEVGCGERDATAGRRMCVTAAPVDVWHWTGGPPHDDDGFEETEVLTSGFNGGPLS